MATLSKELTDLSDLFHAGNESGFEQKLIEINNTFKSEEDVRLIKQTCDGLMSYTENNVSELKTKMQLAEIYEVVNFSSIARRYFGKSKQWINQRLNNSIVNGKQARFTPKEVEILNKALKDISIKIGSTTVTV